MTNNPLGGESLSPAEREQKVVQAVLGTVPDLIHMFYALQFPEEWATPKLDALSAIVRSEAGLIAPEEANRIAEKAFHEQSHINLHLLFLAAWYSMLLNQPQPPFQQLKSIEACINALMSIETPPELRCMATFMQADTAFRVGNYRRKFELLQPLLDELPEESPYYKKLAAMRKMGYLTQGRGHELSSTEVTFQSTEFDRVGLVITEFSDRVLRGDIDRALYLGARIQSFSNHKFMQLLSKQCEATNALLSLLCRARGHVNSIREPQEGNAKPHWVRSTECLLADDTTDALTWARRHAEEIPSVMNMPLDFIDHTLVRAELSAGNGFAAKRLLLDLRARGTETYFDDFYYTRAELLAGDTQAAARHFLELQRSIDRYQAGGRFDFEVKLARELTAPDLVKLKSVAVSASAVSTKPARISAPQLTGLNAIVSVSPGMETVKESITNYAGLELPVIITGETGTGKELVARAIHDVGPRAKEPFIAINCSAIPEALVESELFGYTRGAFTGAHAPYEGVFRAAGKGTVFFRRDCRDLAPASSVTP